MICRIDIFYVSIIIYIYTHTYSTYIYKYMSDMIHDMKSIEFAEEVAVPMEQLRSWGREELQEDPHFFSSQGAAGLYRTVSG